jgi:hypothetical protein
MNNEMLCLAGCGFYASINGYCSACSPTVQIPSAPFPFPSPLVLGETQRAGNSALELLEALDESIKKEDKQVSGQGLALLPLETSTEKKQNPHRCFLCDKKFGLLGFDCECKHTYCKLHRYAETHNCSAISDIKMAGKLKLAKNNPLIQGTSLTDRL